MRCDRIDSKEKKRLLNERSRQKKIDLAGEIKNDRTFTALQKNILNMLKLAGISSTGDDTCNFKTRVRVRDNLRPTGCDPIFLRSCGSRMKNEITGGQR